METIEGLDLNVRRLPIRLSASPRRTITRFFWTGEDRARRILARVESLGDAEAAALVQHALRDFAAGHPDLTDILSEHYQLAMAQLDLPATHSPSRQLLIGTYFTMEYAHESAALFNPSMVPARNQSGLPSGSTRFLMSLRAIGEGHISSIVFRRGVISGDGQISLDPPGQSIHRLRRAQDKVIHKATLRERLKAIEFYDEAIERILARLGDEFSSAELIHAAEVEEKQNPEHSAFRESADRVRWLASSHYDIQIPPDHDASELVLFPIAEQESQGMEDMRLVRFTEQDGSLTYYGTYTAFNGSRIIPQLFAMRDASKVTVVSFQGRFAQNKGLALFPRHVDGQYLMIGRCDAENLYLLHSKNLLAWDEGQILQCPKYAWEFVQIGNCGSPIETEAGWLLLTHGVGPMRKYCIGAMLLDLKNPAKVIGQLSQPLLTPMEEERSGYVPNVVYSCGAMLHNDLLVIPYGISDAATGFATVPLNELLTALTRQ